jgi:DNA-binding SARP family transcriptional activator
LSPQALAATLEAPCCRCPAASSSAADWRSRWPGTASTRPCAPQSQRLFAFLVVNHARAVPRHELAAAVWPDAAPANPDADLSALLSRLRRVLGPGPWPGTTRYGSSSALARESGHRLLMKALATEGNFAEALLVYDRLRVLLHNDLGIAPRPDTQALHGELLARCT